MMRAAWLTAAAAALLLTLLTVSAAAADAAKTAKKEIHLAGIFPISGVEGWQGGQVSLSLYRVHPVRHLTDDDVSSSRSSSSSTNQIDRIRSVLFRQVLEK